MTPTISIRYDFMPDPRIEARRNAFAERRDYDDGEVRFNFGKRIIDPELARRIAGDKT